MSVYVDSMQPSLKNKNWRYNSNCHLVADDTRELHSFAKSIGLRRAWFQNHPRLPHYDLTQNKRRQAVKAGAIEIDNCQLVSMMKGSVLNGKT